MHEMKDSGIEWLGEIPSGWDVIRIKDKYTFDTGFTPDTKHSEYYTDEYGFEWVTIADVKNDRVASPTKSTISREYVKNNYKKQMPAGCLLYSFKLSVGETAITDRPLFTNEAIACFYPSKDININFFKYSSFLIEYNANTNIYGAKILNQQLINNAYVVFPPLEIQKSIANFLDQKCSEINSLSADIQSQIDILEEYKKSVITEAVTKGLNPDVKMKDSGTKWLGLIPETWDISKISNVYTLRNTKVSDFDYPPLSVTMKGVVPQLETAAKTNAHDDRKLVKKGDFAINSRSDRRGSCGIADRDGSVSLINTILCPKGEMNPRYYNWLFHTVEFADEFYANGHGIVDDLWTTGWQEMKRIWIPMPPLDVQQEIANHLDKKCAEIDAIIASKKAQLETLAEYKKSLIYEYVTGKKEVPSNEF